MDKMIYANIKGEKRPLNYSIAVMFEVLERYGNINAALNIIAADGPESFEAVRWLAVCMANDAELCRREEGYDAEPMLKEEELTLRMRPTDFNELRDAVVEAITLGYTREIVYEEAEVDLGLAELNAKKETAGA